MSWIHIYLTAGDDSLATDYIQLIELPVSCSPLS